jgi:type IV pilus assembly protein PilQ
MRTWNKTVGLLFFAAASVYSSRVSAGTAGNLVSPAPEAPATDVRLIDDADPFAAGGQAAPASQPATGGQSVSSNDVNVSDIGTVEIHVNDANLVEVLRMLSLQSQKNIVASKDVRGTVTANLYDVTVREALDAILQANGYAYREKGNFIYVYTAKELEQIEKAERRMQTRVFRLSYTPAANVINLIKPVLSEQGQVAATTPAVTGIPSNNSTTGGDAHANEDALVITDYPENLQRAAEIIAEIDERPQQILLEAVILRAVLNEDNAFGIDFNVLSGVDFTDIVTSSGQFTDASIDPTAAVGDQASSVGTGNSFTKNINGGLRVGYVSDNVSIFLSALEQTTDTTVLANPKILALNKQRGEVFVGNEEGYKTTITTETTTSETVESLKTGTRLIFRPFVAPDGYIRMEVHPEDSSGNVNIQGLPQKSTTEVTSNIMVKDGHTIVIGGLFRESTITGRNQVPVLGELPLAGILFRQQRDRTVREEVIILLTPHIVKDDAAYSKLSEQQLAATEQIRVGMRRGLMPWGRERLAEYWYNEAVKELREPEPNLGRVKWDLDAATNLNPIMHEAIDLREEVTGDVLTASDGSSIRNFVEQAMIADVLPEPPATQPAAGEEPTDTVAPEAVPATQPETETPGASSPATLPVAEDPATQPVAAESAAEPVPAQAEEGMLDQLSGLFSDGESSATAEAPATQPVAESADDNGGADGPVQVIVTELPADEQPVVTVEVEPLGPGR